MKSFTVTLLVLLFFLPAVHGQSWKRVKPLTVGDTLPDVLVRRVIHYPTDTMHTGDFRGKVLILDFFATWCGSCIAFLPHLDSLQQYFGNKLRVLIIDDESTHKVDSAFRHAGRLRKFTHLPIVTADTVLARMFPHRTVPHEVIIDAGGRIQAITHSYYVTRPIVQSVINGKTLHLTVKKELVDYSIQKPLFYYGNGGDINQVSVQSTFCHHVDGLPSYFHTNRAVYDSMLSDNRHRRLLFLNEPVVTLYLNAAYPRGEWKLKRLILEVTDSARYINFHTEPADLWTRRNTYCYELIAPVHTSPATMRKYMLEDLNRYLHIHGRIEKRMENCRVLIRTSGSDSLFRAGTGKLPPATRPTFYHVPMKTLVRNLGRSYHLVVDETGYRGLIDIDFDINTGDDTAVRRTLRRYGLDLIPARRMLDMLVLTEEDFNKRAGRRPPAGTPSLHSPSPSGTPSNP